MATSAQNVPSHHHPVAQTLALLHNWIDYVPQQQRRLGLFIFLAALAHIAAFFFIRITTTRSELRHQPRMQVTFESVGLTAASLASPGDPFWDRMTDPRLHILPLPAPAVAPAMALADELEAMNRDFHPVAMPAPAEIGNYPFFRNGLTPLPERVEETLYPARQPFTYQVRATALAQATTWQWGNSLAQRHPSGMPTLPSPVSDTDISPTRLRVEVNPDGTVGHVILEQSSQVPDLDRQAILAAGKIRFEAANPPVSQWGWVTISWYYTPKPREVAPPPAPMAP